MSYRTEPDGTRVYSHGLRYRPVPDEERKYRRRKPDHPEAVRFRANWFLPLPVLPEDERTFPWTRPDEEAIDHALGCLCFMCRTVDRVKRKKRDRLLRRE